MKKNLHAAATAAFISIVFISSLHSTTLRCFLIGNSVTDQINYGDFEQFVESRGHTAVIARDSIPGAAISFHRQEPDSGFTTGSYGDYPEAFANYTWDALSLQPFSNYSSELTAAQAMVDDFTASQSNAIVYIYAQSLNSQQNSWDAGDWLKDRSELGDAARNADWFADFTNELQTSRPAADIRMVPVGHVFWELHQRMLAGDVPGYSHINQVYQDGWHYPTVGDYIVMMTYYATLLDESPVGLSRFSPYTSLDDTVAAQIEEAAWHVVKRTPLSGRAPDFVITMPSLPTALVNTAYNIEITTTTPPGAVTFSVANGNLPTGLKLSANGTLSGTPMQNGIFHLTLQADAAGETANRDLILFVASDNPPLIETQTLEPIPQGAYTRQYFQHSGGVGGVQWSVAEGQLPHGLNLSVNGELSGTPWCEPGNYKVIIRATDSSPGTPAVVNRQVTVPVIRPETGTLFVGPIASAPTIDGVHDEAFWNLASTANHALTQNVDNAAVFDIRYDAAGLYFACEVTDDNLVSDSGVPFEDDAVVLYLDGLHHRESEFNANDREIVIGADGTLVETNGRDNGMTHAVQTFAGGYRVECFIPWTNFDQPPAAFPGSLGLDVAICDDDNGGARDAWQVWISATPDIRGPFQFGNLNLLPEGIQTNLLTDSGFEKQAFGGTLGFNETIATVHAGKGWHVNVGQRQFTDIAVGDGFPHSMVEAVRPNEGSMLQIVEDGKSTTGPGWLTFDARDGDPAITVSVWGYNGTTAQVDAKITAFTNTASPSGGPFDGLIASATLDPAGAPAGEWKRFNVPADFGNGYDYIVIAFGASASALGLQLDNVQLGAALTRRLTHAPLPLTTDTVPAANLVVGGDFESGLAGTLGFGAPIQTGQTGNGWYANPNSGRTMTRILSNTVGDGSSLSADGSNSGAALQLIRNQKSDTSHGLLTLRALNPDPKMRVFIWGYNGTDVEVNAKIAAVTNESSPSAGQADGLIFVGTLERAGAITDAWEEFAFVANFGDGYDYILIALAAVSGLTNSRIDNVVLSSRAGTPVVPTLTLNTVDAETSELGDNPAVFAVSSSAPSGLAVPLSFSWSGIASTDGSDGDFTPRFAALPARAASVEYLLQAIDDELPEGNEALEVTLESSSTYQLGSPAQSILTILDHPLDGWLFSQFGVMPAEEDSDKDGLHWLVEFFANTDPNDALSRATPAIVSNPMLSADTFELTLTSRGDWSGMEVTFETSTDLLSWDEWTLQSVEVEVLETNDLPNERIETILSLPKPGAAGEPIFARLRLIRASQ